MDGDGCPASRKAARTDDDDLPAVVEPVHQREERGDDARVDLVLLGGAHGREAVDFVEENDGGLAAPRLLEQQPGGCVCVGEDGRVVSCWVVGKGWWSGWGSWRSYVPQLALRLADPLAQAVRALAHEEGDVLAGLGW